VRADLVSVMKGLPDLIGWAEAGADGRSFSFRLTRAASLRQSGDGGVLVLHLTPTAAAAAASASADAPAVRVRSGAHRGYTRIVFDWPMLVDYRAASSDGAIVLNFGAPARFDLSQTGGAAAGLRVEP